VADVRRQSIAVLVRQPLEFRRLRASSAHETVLHVVPRLVDGESVCGHAGNYSRNTDKSVFAGSLKNKNIVTRSEKLKVEKESVCLRKLGNCIIYSGLVVLHLTLFQSVR